MFLKYLQKIKNNVFWLNNLTFQNIILLPGDVLRILFFCCLDTGRCDLYKYLSRKGVDVESVLDT